MYFDYRYPALAAVKSGARTLASSRLVGMSGTAVVQEITADEAPVAVQMVSPKRAGRASVFSFRTYGGRLYKRAKAFDQENSGLDRFMAHAICDRLLAEKAQGAGLGSQYAKSLLWQLYSDNGDDGTHRQNRDTFFAPFWDELPVLDRARFDETSAEEWSALASGYAESLIAIDGVLWVPSDEPMMRCRVGGHPEDNYFADTSVYRKAYGRTSDLPSPYGRDDTRQDTIDSLHLYWDATWLYVPLTEAAELSAASASWKCRVILPEALTTDHATALLDRAARLAVLNLPRIEDRAGAAVMRMNDEIYRHYISLRRITKARAGEYSGDELDAALEGLSDYLGSKADDVVGGFMSRANVPDLIDTARQRWAERTIDMVEAFSGTARLP